MCLFSKYISENEIIVINIINSHQFFFFTLQQNLYKKLET